MTGTHGGIGAVFYEAVFTACVNQVYMNDQVHVIIVLFFLYFWWLTSAPKPLELI